MRYESTTLPDSFTVKSIVTVLRPDFSRRTGIGRGESHDFPEIIYISKGLHTIIIDDVPYEVKAGQILVYAPGAFHRSKEASDASACIISFEADSDALPELYNRPITLTASERQMFTDIVEDGLSCFQRREANSEVGGMILKEGISEYELQKIKKQLELFLVSIHTGLTREGQAPSKSSRRSEEFERAVELLHERVCESLTLAEIAEGCSMSVSKLKILFREMCGTGPISFLIDLKLDEAKRMIREGVMNLTEISEALGFTSLHYFSRLFKERVGVSPSKYGKGK